MKNLTNLLTTVGPSKKDKAASADGRHCKIEQTVSSDLGEITPESSQNIKTPPNGERLGGFSIKSWCIALQ
ncbi:MAG: hypothetical protein H6759_05055 [Candidatus Nomurabacteria bacterium]|nr:MAG: hypothetical protein H6759_05055 [Candidatus Nomurabacteria bacterium]